MKGKRKSKIFSESNISKTLSPMHSFSEILHQNKEVNQKRGRHRSRRLKKKRRGEWNLKDSDEEESQDDCCEQSYRSGSRRVLFRA